MNISLVNGTVIDQTTGEGIVGARVEAWDAAKRVKDLVLYTRTDEDGRFRMEFSEPARKAIFGDLPVSLFFRVLSGTTKDVLFEGRSREIWRPDNRPTEVTLRVTSGRAVMAVPELATAHVRGIVADAAGPLAGVYVVAYDEHLGDLTALGDAVVTDSRGAYRITYDPANLDHNKHRPDLVLKTFSEAGLLTVIAETDRICHVPATAVVNIVKKDDEYRGKTAYAHVLQKLTSLLGTNPLYRLDNDEKRNRIACTARIPQADVDALVFADALSQSSSPLSQEVCYGLLRGGFPANRDDFFKHNRSHVAGQLGAAVKENRISQVVGRDIDEVVENEWVPAAAAWALETRTTGTCGLAEILDAAEITSSGTRTDFAKEFCRHDGAPTEFWASVATLSSGQKSRAELAFQWWSLSRGFNPLMQYLKTSVATYPTLDSLCSLSDSDWGDILDDSAVGVPSSIPGVDTAAKRANYIRVLYRTVAATFPTKTFVQRARVASEEQNLKDFFTNNPSFEFGTTRFFQTNLSGTTDPTLKRLKAMDRMMKLVPRYEEVVSLIGAGYHSAHAMSSKGHKKFVDEMADLLGGSAVAEKIYQLACFQTAASSAIHAKYSPQYNNLPVASLPDSLNPSILSPPQNQVPDWQTLFGNAGGCACKQCESVLSASAYLVDLLQWVSHFDSEVPKTGETKWSALDVLVGDTTGSPSIQGRRPDLKLLELTCKSSHTPLPYIDLANEIMEVAVAAEANNSAWNLTSPVRTSFDADDLLAGPEIVHPAAHVAGWTAIAESKYPFSHPVDLWAEETNAYLGYLGVHRSEIVVALHAGGATYEKDLAKTRLSVRNTGFNLLQENGGTSASQAWGGHSIDQLNNVPMMLKYAGITFEQLEELLSTRYINGVAGTGALDPQTGAALAQLELTGLDMCNVSTMELPALADGHRLRIHAFLRLVKRTGLTITDLDRILSVLPCDTQTLTDRNVLDDVRLQHLTRALHLAERLHLPITDIAAFYANLDTRETYKAESPFRSAFLNRMVDSPEAAAFKTILEGGTVSTTLENHRTSLQQALALSAFEFDLLTDVPTLEEHLKLRGKNGTALEHLVADKAEEALSLSAISRLYRTVQLARALGLSIADFLVLKAHAADIPLGAAATPLSTEKFCDTVRDFQSQTLSVADLQHVLRGISPQNTGLAPSDADIEALRASLVAAVDNILSETESSHDVDGARTEALLIELAPLWGSYTPKKIYYSLVGFEYGSNSDFVRDSVAALLPYVDTTLASNEEGLKAALAGTADGTLTQWTEEPRLRSFEARASYVAKWLERYIRSERALVEKLAAFHKLPVSTIRYLMNEVMDSTAVPSEHAALVDFLPAQRKNTPETLEIQSEVQRNNLRLLERHVRLIKGLRIHPPIPAGPDGMPTENLGELLWVYPDPAATTGLHKLPFSTPAAPTFGLEDADGHFAQILLLTKRIALRDTFTAGPDSLRQMLLSLPSDPAQARLVVSRFTGWELASLETLMTAFGMEAPADLEDEAQLLRLSRAISLVRKLGLPADRCLDFLNLELAFPTNLTPNEGAAQNARDLVLIARRAAKAKVSAEQWAQVARNVRDPFRELLRDSLLAYFVPEKWASASETFGMLLIDPEMSACQKTSRVVQATNSVQSFVQRSFLNLDAEVKLPLEASKQWEFYKSYRLWEANRNVFLYPENWIEPDLRDDKTPLFKAFETKLRQGEITSESAERALETYLTGLDEIARLQVMATCYDQGTETTHIVARTRSLPRKWHYRKHTQAEGFLPWEPMGLDIDGEGLLLVSKNRRLYLFWPVLSTRPSENQPVALPFPFNTEASEPISRMQVKIAFSSRMEGTWTPKRLSMGTGLKIRPAKGEMGTIGLESHDCSLVCTPGSEQTNGRIDLSVVFESGLPRDPDIADDLESRNTLQIGQFVFDPAGGGTFTEAQSYEELDFQTGDLATYSPPMPFGTQLKSDGFGEVVGNGEVAVQRPILGSTQTFLLGILKNHEAPFRIVAPSSSVAPYFRYDRFVFEDAERSLFVRIQRNRRIFGSLPTDYIGLDLPDNDLDAWGVGEPFPAPQSKALVYDTASFHNMDHPFVGEFARALAEGGVSGLLGWSKKTDSTPQFLTIPTEDAYGGTPVPDQIVEFTYGGAYSTYNWELFFHVPMLIATRLSDEGRYEEAQKWYHHIFHPTADASSGAKAPQRYWKFREFHENEDLATIQEQLSDLALESTTNAEIQALLDKNAALPAAVQALEIQIATLREKPFNPHALARHRVLAYQKTVVMKYIDNLLDWADALFRRDTLESMHEALSLYLLAGDLLGPRPTVITHKADPVGKTYDQLKADGLDAFSNAAIEVESLLTPASIYKSCNDEDAHLPAVRTYFCVPQNKILLGYWDRVSDRLFKLRNCLDIEGVARQVPLFAPPIDPALLVKAAAAGVSFDKVLNALAAPAPLFRFLRLHSKAVEMASQVSGLGQALLTTLEKRDGEELTRLRQTHELALLDIEQETRKLTIQEARESLAGLQRQRAVVERREEYYRTIRDRIPEELEAKKKADQAQRSTLSAGMTEGMGAIYAAIPDFFAKAGFPPDATVETGGMAAAAISNAVARGFGVDASLASMNSGALQTEAGYLRRRDEWRLQAQLAQRELRQIDKQIAAQEIRIALAEHERSTLELRTQQSHAVDEFIRTKFAGQDLYDWMVSEIAAEHYRAYQVAFDMAKKAEAAFHLEIGDNTKTFIRFGAWDSLKRGLLAGERLLGDLRALDAAYLSRTDREREIVKHIPISQLWNPEANASPHLVQLRDTGSTEVEIPEWLLDADYPGHYFRRLKAVSISIPTVRNALDGVQCELALLDSKFRKSPLLTGGLYPEDPVGNDELRFGYVTRAIEALSTSTADDDAGLFQLDLRDEKLLPFEGSGVIGTYRIEVPKTQNRFPLHKLSDAVLHLRYTSRDAGKPLSTKALEAAGSLAKRSRTISLRTTLEEAWARFMAGEPDGSKHRLLLPINRFGFATFFGKPNVKITGLILSVTYAQKYNPPDPSDDPPPTLLPLKVAVKPPGIGSQTLNVYFRIGEPSASWSGALNIDVLNEDETGYAPWEIEIASGSTNIPSGGIMNTTTNLLHPDALEDIWATFTYVVKE